MQSKATGDIGAARRKIGEAAELIWRGEGLRVQLTAARAAGARTVSRIQELLETTEGLHERLVVEAAITARTMCEERVGRALAFLLDVLRQLDFGSDHELVRSVRHGIVAQLGLLVLATLHERRITDADLQAGVEVARVLVGRLVDAPIGPQVLETLLALHVTCSTAPAFVDLC